MIVTSFSAEGYTKYGARFIESFLEFWKDEKLVVYVEAPIEFEHERVEFRDLFAINGMEYTLDFLKSSDMLYQGKRMVNNAKMYDYRFDAYRFCRKVFAMADIGVQQPTNEKWAWIDADVVFHAEVPEGFIDSLLPDDVFAAYLARPWLHCETGFIAFNPAHPNHNDFMEMMKSVYASGAFKYLGEWHDCYVIDFLLAATAMETVNLAEGLNVEHVFINTVLGKYCDHLKGPQRKDKGRSPQSEVVIANDTPYWKGPNRKVAGAIQNAMGTKNTIPEPALVDTPITGG